MKVECHLRRRNETAPASALLVRAGPDQLLALCGQLPLTRFPDVHRVAGGFLIKLPVALDRTFPGALCLRLLAENLFVPVNAELVPPLLPDEASGLTRERGLIFMPGRLLAFDPRERVSLAALVTARLKPRRDWQALPARRPLAERIVSIQLDLPDEDPNLILERGGAGQDIGNQPPPRPEDSSLPARAAGTMIAGVGKLFIGLGAMVGWKGLAELGARWVERATALVPRLSESLLGAQEAALRELLRQFRSGNIDEALRRALPIGDDAGRGPMVPYTSSQLPWHQLTYSLSSLLGSVAGIVPTWLGGYDVQRELAAEYRRAAEEACARGDYRRAAFIYGRLLSDFSAAANALMRGQLHHDAAILYLRKLNDRRSAARAFELAGELDTALALWRELGDHLSAGDLLQRMGDEEGALLEFRAAADQLARNNEHLAGYQVMINRARRPDLARGYLEQGWSLRPEVNGVACGSRLAQHLVEEEDVPAFLAVLEEGRTTFAAPGDDVAAAQFFNAVANLAERPVLGKVRDDVRDHCLVGLAVKLQQRSQFETGPGDVVSNLFGRSTAWPAPLVGDARFAFAQAIKDRPALPAVRPAQVVRVGVGVVTAVCHVPATGDVLVGFLSGDVLGFSPMRNVVYRVKSGDGMEVTSLAADREAELVAVMQLGEVLRLCTFHRDAAGSYHIQARHTYPIGERQEHGWLSPTINEDAGLIGSDGNLLSELDPQTLSAKVGSPLIPSSLGLCFLYFDFMLVSDGHGWRCVRFQPTDPPEELHWHPAKCPESSLRKPHFTWWIVSDDEVLLAGIDSAGKVRLANVPLLPLQDRPIRQSASVGNDHYRAAAIVRSTLIAAVTDHLVAWFRVKGNQLVHAAAPTPTPKIKGSVACFASPHTGEVLIVCRDGHLARVKVPANL
ncbi:MAG: hypothetical protein AB7K24_05580 [Gemmataceae bacterium]